MANGRPILACISLNPYSNSPVNYSKPFNRSECRKAFCWYYISLYVLLTCVCCITVLLFLSLTRIKQYMLDINEYHFNHMHSVLNRDVLDIHFRFRLAGYPDIFQIRFWLRFRPKRYQVPDISSG